MIYQVLTALTPLATAPYIARALQPEGVGIFSFVNSVMSYFILAANLGTVTYAQREISYVQEDDAKRNEIFWNVLSLRFITSLVTFAVYLFFSYFSEFRTLFFILSINIISIIFDISWLYQGMENFDTIMRKNIIFRLLTIFAIFMFVHHEEDLPLYCFILGLGTLLTNLSQWSQLPTLIRKPSWSSIHPFSDVNTVLSLFVPTIAIQIYTILDKTMIGMFSGVGAENGYYEEAMKFARITQMLVTSLSVVMIPRIGNYFSQRKYKEVQKYLYQSFQYIWAVSIPMCFGLIGISDNLIPWFLGENYGKVSALLKILALLLISIGINTVTGNEYLIPTNRQRLYTKTVLIGAIVNICFNALLIPNLLSVGAAVASVIAESTIAGCQLYLIKKELSIGEMLKRSTKYFISGSVMLLILRIENKYFFPSLLHTGIMILTGVAVYSVALLILKDTFVIENLKTGVKAMKK